MSDAPSPAVPGESEDRREFVCDVEPLGDGWEVWISETPYRGVDTDAALNSWDRKRVGAAWSSRHFVGKRRGHRAALRMARWALAEAERTAAVEDRENAAWRANARRQATRITSSEASL